MKKLIQRLTAMSVALILFSATTVAQNEKSTKSVTDESSHGVVVSNSYVQLKSGEETEVFITLNPGYTNPTMIYAGQTFDINNKFINAGCFTAELSLNEGGGIILIRANEINETDSDVIYIKAMIDYGDNTWSSKTIIDYGVPIVVVVDPNLKKTID